MSMGEPHIDTFSRGKAHSNGDFPAMIDVLDAALDVFETEEAAQ